MPDLRPVAAIDEAGGGRRHICLHELSASPGTKKRCKTRQPPAANVAPTAIAKLPAQKKPFAVQVRTFESTAKIWRQRQHWIAAAR
jgi:hypothetical protein